MEPTWNNFADFLAAELPQLREEIEESYLGWLEAFKDPYPHVFLEEFVAPLLLGTAPVCEPNARLRAGEILDRVLTCADQDLAEAALTTILEAFRDDSALRELAWPYLGPTARQWTMRLLAGSANRGG